MLLLRCSLLYVRVATYTLLLCCARLINPRSRINVMLLYSPYMLCLATMTDIQLRLL